MVGYTSSVDFPNTTGAFDKWLNDNGSYPYFDGFVFKLNYNGSQLLYSTFIGGTGNDGCLSLSIDSSGNVYATGWTKSLDFPTTANAYDDEYNGGAYDCFSFKLNRNGSALIYSTYLGGDNLETQPVIAIDTLGFAYITGYTNSPDFPNTTGTIDNEINGDLDAFITKLNQTGTGLIFSTYIGGSETDYSTDITLDSNGNIYVFGITESLNFPTTPKAFDTSLNGTSDAFLLKLNNNGSKLLNSTFLGGNMGETGESIDLDLIGNIYMSGNTRSSDFPTTTGAYDDTLNGTSDAFLVKFTFENFGRIEKLDLLKNEEITDIIYSKLGAYTFRSTVFYPINHTDLETVILSLDPTGANIQLKWDNINKKGSKLSDPNNYLSLQHSSAFYSESTKSWIIDFNFTMAWTYPDIEFHDVVVNATGKDLAVFGLNANDFYRVENNLVFYGDLSVTGINNRTIKDGGFVGCGENLNWTGLVPVYEGTTDVYPPDDEFNITIWDEAENSWMDSPDVGETFKIETITPNKPYANGYTYRINISGIPKDADGTNVTFTVKIDWRNLTFSNPKPDENSWQNTSKVTVGITITNIGLGEINGSSVKYSVSSDNGTAWDAWRLVPGLLSSKILTVEEPISFEDGENNLIKWSAQDSFGNEPLESDEYRILVDTKNATFSDEFPKGTQESFSETVEVGITISDNLSGVNGSSIEYSISADKGNSWGDWTPVPGLKDDRNIDVKLNLKFPNGTGNRIKWRASDIAGNGPSKSEAYKIIVNISKEKPKPKPKVRLLKPENNSIIANTTVTLTWFLENSNLSGVEYDIIFDTITPPSKIEIANYTNTSIMIQNLTNGKTYYWQVLPKLGTQNGTCISGVWSFAVNTTKPIPVVTQIFPENNAKTSNLRPTLTWSLEYTGLGIVTYDIYLNTSYPPDKRVADHPATRYTPDHDLEDGRTYYWKIVPKVGNITGKGSEIWSFTLDINYTPIFDLELSVEPTNVEMRSGESKLVTITVKNLGELKDNILLNVSIPNNVTGVNVNYSTEDNIELLPGGSAVINVTITVALGTARKNVIITIEAISQRAPEFGLEVKKTTTFEVRIISDPDTAEDSNEFQKSVYFWFIYLIVIAIIILSIVLYMKIERSKVLANLQREAIFNLIKEKPSIHFREIMRKLSLKPGSLSYHLNVLEKKNFIKSIQKGEYRCFYLKDEKSDFKIMLSTLQQRVLFVIDENPGITLTELSTNLGKNKMVLNYHTNLLEDAGVITKEKRGRIPTFYVTSLASHYLG